MHGAAALGPDGADRAQLQILCFSHMEVWWVQPKMEKLYTVSKNKTGS